MLRRIQMDATARSFGSSIPASPALEAEVDAYSMPPPHVYVSSVKVGGIPVRVEWDDGDLSRAVETTLAYLGSPSDVAPIATPLFLRFALHDAPLAVPPEAVVLSESPGGIQFLGDRDALYLRYQEAVVIVRPQNGTARGTLPLSEPAPRDALLYSLLFYSTVALLYHRGYRAIHAGSLVRDGHGCLIVGDSDRGKSTLTLRLVEQGWRYLTDDSVLLKATDRGIVAQPLRRDFCLDPDAETLFPGVVEHWRPHLADPRKRQLRIQSLYPDRSASYCVITTILFPQIVPELESELRPLARKETLLRLLEYTGAPAWLDRPAVDAHMNDLAALSAQAQGYVLLAGSSLRDDPAAASRLSHQLLP